MQKLDLTKWLEMVWDALKQQDELRRNHLLRVADGFLQNSGQESEVGSAPLEPRDPSLFSGEPGGNEAGCP